MEAYPDKLRELVFECYDEGLETSEIAERFKVSCDWVRKVRRRWRDHGIRTAIKQKHGPDPLMDAVRRQELARLVEQTPDATLDELRKQLRFPVSISTVFRTLNEMKLSLKKKSINASEQERPDVKSKREDWEHCLPGLDLDRLVFLDECGINTLMARLHGRCPQGKRLVDSSPAACWQTTTLLSAVRLDGVIAPMMLPGAINGESFAGYIEQFLVCELQPGDIVIMDNLSSHKSQRVSDAIKRAGCTLVYLPPYSPDLNPIENMWSKIKACLRKTGARTFEALVDAVRNALLAVTPEDCEGYFEHCGYSETAT